MTRKFSDFALNTLKARYLREEENGWSDLARRVTKAAMAVKGITIEAIEAHLHKDPEYIEKAIYEMINDRKFIPNSPTLMNAGSENFQPSACFVLEIEDSIDSIFGTLAGAAKIFKSGGGVGMNFRNIRPEGMAVGDQAGVASGPISFAKIFNEMTEQMKQGGRRKGALMGMLDITHPDIVKFIKAKDDLSQLTNFNISVAMDNRFMDIVTKEKSDIDDPFVASFNGVNYYIDKETDNPFPQEHYVEERNIYTNADVWDLIVKQAHKNGEPGVIFLERMKEINGENIISTNPCGEQALADGEACILGSIDLGKFYNKETNDFNLDEFAPTVKLATLFLNLAIDSSKYPLEKITRAVNKTRKIGLGVMGFADLCLLMGIKYGSIESFDLAGRISSILTNQARQISEELELGNEELTTCAPTGTISTFAGCSSGIEPIFKPYIKQFREGLGTFYEVPNVLKEYFEWEGTDKEFVEALESEEIKLPEHIVFADEVTPKQHVKMQAVWQINITNSISKTINMPSSATLEDVKTAYKLAWNLGCKGITVYRDGSRMNQPISDGSKKTENRITEPKKLSVTQRPEVVEGKIFKEKIELGHNVISNVYVSVGMSSENNPMEIFVNGNIRTENELINQYIDTVTRLLSLMMRSGVPLKDVIEQLDKIHGTMAFSLPVKLSKVLSKFLPDETKFPCPECGAEAIFTEGCKKCTVCGWSACGG
jgi:ribonucleoside-diphosphate reductase alpha chain